MDNHQLKIIIAAATIYISLIILANLGSLRILFLAGLSVDGGSLLYPLTFTVRDMLHKKTGAEITRFIIWLAAGINIILFLFVWLIGVLPPDPTIGSQAEYALVLTPGVRLVVGSIVAMTISELLDTRIYSLVRIRFGQKKQWLRVLLSNAFSVPVDTAIFLAIAFIGRFPISVIGAMFIANIIIKYLVSLVSLGGIYLIKEDRA